MRLFALLLLPVLAGCLVGTKAEPEKLAATTAEEEAWESVFGVHPRAREQHLKQRFPGLDHLRLVKVVISAHDRAGPCWTAVSPLRESGLELEYARENDSKERSLSGTAALGEHGGQAVYRTPEGRGFELTGPFRSIDLAVDTSFGCRCSTRDGVLEGDDRSLTLRLRWSKGAMPEVSAAASDETRRETLRPRLTSGELFGYEFETGSPFPEAIRGRCGVRVDLALLVDPPIQ